MLGLAGKMPILSLMTEIELWHWVTANPGRVNDRDRNWTGCTALLAAAYYRGSLPPTVWLLEEKGADVNATTSRGSALCMKLGPWTSSSPCWNVALSGVPAGIICEVRVRFHFFRASCLTSPSNPF